MVISGLTEVDYIIVLVSVNFWGWDFKTSSRDVVYIWFVSHFRTDNKPFWPPYLDQQMRLWYHVKFERIMDFYLKPIGCKRNGPNHICLNFRYGRDLSTSPWYDGFIVSFQTESHFNTDNTKLGSKMSFWYHVRLYSKSIIVL